MNVLYRVFGLDFVLVYKDDADEAMIETREYYHTNLRRAGLHIEEVQAN